MALATLPDVDLLEVLSYLGPKELLRCRAVCRRWRSLALHPLLWRTKKLYAYWNEKPCRLVLAVLRHAPRLRYLCLGSGERSLDLCGGLLGLTNCAVSRLDIHCSEADAVLFALALSRQAVLGRLKEVSLTVGRMQPQQDESWRQRLDVLFDQLVYTRGLERIYVSQYRPEAALPASVSAGYAEVPEASLRELCFDVRSDGADAYLKLLLQFHATTLEKVKMEWACSPGLAALLGALPRLRELRCTLLDDMAALLPCPSLKDLFLKVVDDEAPRPTLASMRPRLSSLETFLRSAVTHLEHLELFFGEDEPPESVEVVRSLGGTAPAALQSLRLYVLSKEEPPHLRPLAAILHRLPHLTSLDINGVPTEAFLDALDGRVLPKLLELKVYQHMYCAHEWIHSEPVRRVLFRNPRMHIEVRDVECEECDCEFCEEHPSCHAIPNDETCILFTHPKDVQCGLDHEDRMEIFIGME